MRRNYKFCAKDTLISWTWQLSLRVVISIGQFWYFKIQLKTIDITTRLWGINPTNSIVYSPEPRAEVYCLMLHINISKLGYFHYELLIQFKARRQTLLIENILFFRTAYFSCSWNLCLCISQFQQGPCPSPGKSPRFLSKKVDKFQGGWGGWVF